MSETQNIATMTDWQLLCDSFSTDPTLYSEVRLAAENPLAYLERFRTRLAERDITTPEGVSPWLALVHWLDDNDRLVDLDDDTSSEDLVDYLTTLPIVAASGANLRPVVARDVHLAYSVPRASLLLAPHYWTLLYLDTDTASYPLALVSTEAAPRIRELAAAVGHSARPIDETDAAEAARAGLTGYTVPLAYATPQPSGPRPGNVGLRMLGFLLDAVLFYGVVLGGVWLGITINGSNSGGLIPTVMLIVAVAYLLGLALVVGRTGQSLGLLAVGLKVVRADSVRAPGFGSALGRGALLLLSPFAVWLVVLIITTLVDPSRRGMHDKAAGTFVAYSRGANAAK